MTPEAETIEIPEIVLDFSALDRMPTDDDLPCDDGEPLETFWHRPAINLLIECIEHYWAGRKDFFAGGNMFMYFSKKRVFNKDFRGPDFFVAKGVDHDKKRKSWIYWQENRNPNLIIELSSESTVKTDRVDKKIVYGEEMRVPEYFIYDPQDGFLTGWRLVDGGYSGSIEVEPSGRIWSEQLGMFIGPWDGVYQGHHERWLRFFDAHGNLIPTGQEAATIARANAEARVQTEATARAAAEIKATAEAAARANAESEIERLKREIETLRRSPPAP